MRAGVRGSPPQTSEQGALTAPLALTLMVATTFGFGLYGVIREFRLRMETALRLDRCVANRALSLQQILESLERTNTVIETTRAALMVDVEPATRAALRATLLATVKLQEVRLLQWTITQARWLSPGSCLSRGDFPVPIAGAPFQRPIPDLLGPKPLTRTGTRVALTRGRPSLRSRVEIQWVRRKWSARFL